MTQLSGPVQVAGQPLFSTSAIPQHVLGERMISPDGRVFRYCKAGGTTLVPGKLQQAAAEVTADQNLAVAANSIGDTTIVTTSTVTVTANQYAGGYVVVSASTGAGYQYRIKSHPAATAAVVTLTLEDPIIVALATSSKIDLFPNPFDGVIVNPASASSAPVGAAIYPITNGQYGWLQTAGPCAILADGTVTVGTALDASNGTAGAVEAHPEAGVQAPVALALTGIATTEYGLVKLLLE